MGSESNMISVLKRDAQTDIHKHTHTHTKLPDDGDSG